MEHGNIDEIFSWINSWFSFSSQLWARFPLQFSAPGWVDMGLAKRAGKSERVKLLFCQSLHLCWWRSRWWRWQRKSIIMTLWHWTLWPTTSSHCSSPSEVKIVVLIVLGPLAFTYVVIFDFSSLFSQNRLDAFFFNKKQFPRQTCSWQQSKLRNLIKEV